MKIQQITSIYNSFKNSSNCIQRNNEKIVPFSPLTKDIVSFRAKQYSADSIINPTNHCAYCGCKVYNESQLDSIAKEMLVAKGSRLEGNIKSVLEKLEEAKHSQELAVAKRIENKEEIEFFKAFLEASSKRAYLKGAEIFEQVYHQDEDSAKAVLMTNLHPLMRTIDHMIPQREEKENTNSDINLVEACGCCNQKLKKGISFNEFYAMFPTIKNNMPKEKFEYAAKQALDTSQSQILKRLSAVNMLKFLELLFVQRTEAKNALDSVDYRIQGCKSGIENSVENCKQEIKEKEAEKQALEIKLAELKKDPEFVAMLRREELSVKLDGININLEALRHRKFSLQGSIDSLQGTQKKKRKNKPVQTPQMTEAEKKAKLEQLTKDLELVTSQIDEQENSKFETEIEIEDLNNKYPTVEMLSKRKSSADNIINAYSAIEREEKLLQERTQKKAETEQQEAEIIDTINSLPDSSEAFVIEARTEEEQVQFKHYGELTEALKYIDEHPNGGYVRVLIHSKAKTPLEKEIAEMEKLPVIIDYKNYEYRKKLKGQLEKIKKSKEDIISLIHHSEKSIKINKRTIEGKSLEEAQEESSVLAERIRTVKDKQNNIQLPKIITKTSMEIDLLENTIKDLIEQQKKIEAAYSET